jgi:hypothetical protein
MKLDPARLAGWALAALLLALVVQQTAGALRASGVWTRPGRATPAVSPYDTLEHLLVVVAGAPAEAPVRNPFAFGRATTVAPPRRPAVAPPARPAEPARPQLTAIVWVEGNPSATVRWNGKDHTVQVNSLFDEFRVRGITREQVILERGGEPLVLQLPRKGD